MARKRKKKASSKINSIKARKINVRFSAAKNKNNFEIVHNKYSNQHI